MIVLIVLAAALVVALVVTWMYNGMVRSRNQVDDAWSQIDVQLKRRYDLIPNLVETVKGYATYERGTFDAVVHARSMAMDIASTGTVAQRGDAENVLTGALKSVFALAEAYPQLKANQNYIALQEQLAATEDQVAYSRQFYNDAVQRYNTRIQAAPRNLLAGPLHFTPRGFFAAEPESREPVTVTF